MKNAINDVREFMQIGGQATPAELVQIEPNPAAESPAGKLASLRIRLMTEELSETIQALVDGNMPEFADGLADLLYVTIGTALAYGIPLEAVWTEVQRSNMAKFSLCQNCLGKGYDEEAAPPCPSCDGHGRVAIRDPGGKVQKPAGWTPPNIAAVLTRTQAPASAPKRPTATCTCVIASRGELRSTSGGLISIPAMRRGAQILGLNYSGGFYQLWTAEDPRAPLVTRNLRLCVAGDEVPGAPLFVCPVLTGEVFLFDLGETP